MRTKIFYILVLLLFFTVSMDAQCAMCRAVLESEEGQNTAKGINNGIVYLMIIPYVLIGVVGYFIYRNKKKPIKD
ncbi:hypothetical protein J8L88_10215 [Aquimarina sp. MMG015]|uniref:hypothetical protein n=1 Tax=unclassified Aquimarina TaxID=2627091 RepID=UPI000E4AB009|nr:MULTISPECIES: hypothetical protein [unclassified Aquimarina]AXT57836.1 hypothetical protein D1815_19520 [Aquimarina sp. AD1]MBQ4803222.1 hypothetical protein [Aquimarina sp. MMG015]RKN35004.1 hypothetical protein D7035_03720 [Aquimarina sp. AD1]